MNDYIFSDVVIKKILDGDFQTKMEGVQFSTTPREVVTIRHMEKYWETLLLKGRDIDE